MTAPTFFASLWLATDIVLIETIARDGVRLETKHGLRTARKGARSPSSPDTLLDVRGLRPARLHPLGIEGGLLGVLYEKISHALAPLGNSGC